MAIPTFKLWTDAGLTTEFAGPLVNDQDADGSTADQDYVLYIGSNDAAKTMQTKVNPGIDQISLSIADTAPAAGPEVSHVKLALTNAALDAAVAGDPLNLGLTIAGGVVNAVPVHIRISAPIMPGGEYNHLSISDNGTEEV